MSFYNGILNHDDIHGSGQLGPRGLPGIGFKVDADGNYDIENKKLTNVKNGDKDNDVMVKSQIEGYVNTNFVAISGDTMTGPLIVQKDNYPVQGNLNKIINYETQREIFLSKKEGGKMEQAIDINGFSIDNLPIPTDPDHACNKYYIDHNFLNRLTGGQMGGDLDMRGHSIKYLKLDNSDNAAARVAELNLKLNLSGGSITGDLLLQKKYQYPLLGDLKKVINYENIREIFLSRKESFPMNADLNMNNHLIQNVKDPVNAYNGVNKKYVDDKVNSKADLSDLNDYLKLDGSRIMAGDLQMNNHMITNVKNPLNDSDAVNKGYLDNHSIQPAHTQKNALDYIMNDIDQTSSEYGIEIDRIDNYNDSFHSYNKKVIYLNLLKDGNNYRSRIGYNIFKLIDKSKDRYYTAVIEWLTTDNNVWNKMDIFNNITSGSIILNQTRKFEDGKGLYYTRSIIQFEVMAISTSPLYLLSTIHVDGVNPTYPAKFSEVYNIIYGIDGSHTTISPIVFDYHNTYDIKNNKMTMNVDLDMNNKAINNVSNLSIDGFISIYGTVHQSKYFTTSNIALNFRQIKIGYIRIHGTQKTRNKSDILKITDRSLNEIRYPFRFPHVGGMVHISINRFFEVINSIQLTNTTNVAFQIGYSLFY